MRTSEQPNSRNELSTAKESVTCAFAAEGGHLEVMQWARAHGCEWDEWTCAYAAGGGHLAALRWAQEHGCEWDERTCAYAAEGGHLEVLQWAREQDCPWGVLTCAYAAAAGHLAVLQWAREHGCDWDEQTCAHAAGDGRGLQCVAAWQEKKKTVKTSVPTEPSAELFDPELNRVTGRPRGTYRTRTGSSLWSCF